MAKPYRLRQVSPKEIRFSRDNPRGETPEDIKNDKTFEQLKDSVAQFGVLVPLVVHEKKMGDGKSYTLVDGERRLRAALATNTEKVPAHIASTEDRMGEIIQAFHIHMLRKQWKPVAIARAFKRIKQELKKSRKSMTEKELLRELQANTGCTNNQLEDLQRAVKYPEAVLKGVDDGKIAWSHLVQFEASFVEQLEQHYPHLLLKLGRKEVRRVLVEKAQQKVIRTTRELIENILPIVQRAKNATQKKVAARILERFITEADVSPGMVKMDYDRRFPPPRDQLELANEILKTCELLNPMIEQIESGQIISFTKKAKELKKVMEALKQTVGRKLRQLTKLIG
jgi:ParB/RepB/Spo0J family partition protein